MHSKIGVTETVEDSFMERETRPPNISTGETWDRYKNEGAKKVLKMVLDIVSYALKMGINGCHIYL